MGDHPQSFKFLVLDSELVLWRKGEIEFVKIEKILKFNANKLLKPHLRWQRTFCIMDQQVYFSGELNNKVGKKKLSLKRLI